jgi:ribonucleoside-diphosphate reductase beta chain
MTAGTDLLAEWDAPADEPGSRDDRIDRLYRRWEQQPWSALAVDLSADRAIWGRIPVTVRSEMEAAVTELGGGDVAVTRLLTPLIDHAPKEGWRLFLTTQLSDETKHAVFFRRYAGEVFPGSVADPELTDFPDSAYTTEFEPVLREAVLALRAEPSPAAWYRASALYHLITEGVLGVTVLRLGQALSADPRMCPGLAEGVAAVFRDESRHIGFGRTAAGEGLATGHGAAIADGYRLGVATAARVMVGPAREQHDPANPRWRAQRGQVKRDRIADAFGRTADQAGRLGLPVGRQELQETWDAAVRAAFRDYRERWGRPHAADPAAQEAM